MSRSAEELFREYEGQIVPRTIHGGFVALSYVVSLIGALSTLELINRRTAQRGLFNYVLLAGSAISMGGVAIWCMHFIGNRAIVLADGQPSLQISYSAGFTVLSFFVPIIVLLVAFTAIGADSNTARTPWVRLVAGGSLAGCAICGMHYLGDASISNYGSEYKAAYVVGSAIIAVAASNVALAMFFVFRHAWANSWWKTLASGVVLAGAVSGMHWCGVMGTRQRLREVTSEGTTVSINKSVIAVIVLSVVSCLLMAGTAIYTAKARKESAKNAQEVVLAAAVFDKNGRILINRNGLLPSECITDTFLDKSSKDKFDTNHPLFHWMFRASRNWSGIQPLIDGMVHHLSQLPRQGRDRHARADINLVSEHGDVMEGYDVVFRELFCVAASSLAAKMKEHISDIGVLWEEVLATGAGGAKGWRVSGESGDSDGKDAARMQVEDLEQGRRSKKDERGSLMFLVRRVENDADVSRLGAAGYRFVDVHHVAGSIAASMQMKNPDPESKFKEMAQYTDSPPSLEPGVHVAFFGIRPKGSGSNYDILVRKDAKSLLPSVRLPAEKLTSGHLELLGRLEGMTAWDIERKVPTWKDLSKKEASAARHLVDAIQDLRAWVGDKIVQYAVITPETFQAPCVSSGTQGHATATLIALRLVMPADAKVVSANCTFIPLSLFKVHQLTSPANPHHLAFSREVHREFAPIINVLPGRVPAQTGGTLTRTTLPGKLKKFGRKANMRYPDPKGSPAQMIYGQGRTPSIHNRSTSTLKLWDRSSAEQPSEPAYDPTPAHTNLSMLGGIMISEEVTVNVQNTRNSLTHSSDRTSDGESTSPGPGEEGGDAIEMGQLHGTATSRVANVEVERLNDLVTFVDELYARCMDDR